MADTTTTISDDPDRESVLSETRENGQAFSELSQDTVEQQVPLIALEKDFHQIPGQKFAVLSFIDANQYQGARIDGAMSHPMHLIKVRGVFATKEAATVHVKQCQKMDTFFDYHIVETHTWTTIGASTGKEQEWEDDTVNDVMGGYFDKENDTLSNIEHRIQASRDGVERSDEASKFWSESQSNANCGGSRSMDHMPGSSGPPTDNFTFKPMSLHAAAAMAQ